MEKFPTFPPTEPKPLQKLEIVSNTRIPEGVDETKHPIERPVKELFGRLMSSESLSFFEKLTDLYGEDGAALIARQSVFKQGELTALGVSNLTITELPKDIPDTVRQIFAEKTSIKSIHTLPPDLLHLDISGSSVEEIPFEAFPATLQSMQCSGTPFSENEIKYDPQDFLAELKQHAPNVKNVRY